jgi:hypothetical protein
MTSATPAMLRDKTWGARTVGSIPSVGDTLTVRTRDGRTFEKRVTRIEWSGRDNTTGDPASLCAVEATQPRKGTRSTTTRGDRGKRTGCACGSIEDQPRNSDCASCRHDY